MKKIKFIANPVSGKELSLKKINELVNLFSKDGYKIDLRFTKSKGDAMDFAMEDEGEDILVSVGGDGTLNEVVNGIYRAKKKTPLAIYKAGTVNDFANVLEIPDDTYKFYEMIKNFNVVPVDIGLAGDRAFANVAAGGLFTNIAYEVETDLKNRFGRLAYYAQGVRELYKYNTQRKEKLKITFKSEQYNETEKLDLFLVSNSSYVGGFKNIVPNADVRDGYLHVLIIKDIDIKEFPDILSYLIDSTQFKTDNIKRFKTKEITISSETDLIIDLDGEKSNKLPMTFKVLEKELNLILM
ncbi:Diacylglycerol kinase catalytic region [Peptoniphilus sp. ING2-D1G]|nr:Diacylglycerol kinase catalytic region [Peptoniphilus sp. ING2-D1G]